MSKTLLPCASVFEFCQALCPLTSLRKTHAARLSSPISLRTPATEATPALLILWTRRPLCCHLPGMAKRSGSPVTESTLVSNTSSSSRSPSLPAMLISNSQSYPLLLFIDSGSDDNFIDENFVTQVNIPLKPLYSCM